MYYYVGGSHALFAVPTEVVLEMATRGVHVIFTPFCNCELANV